MSINWKALAIAFISSLIFMAVLAMYIVSLVAFPLPTFIFSIFFLIVLMTFIFYDGMKGQV